MDRAHNAKWEYYEAVNGSRHLSGHPNGSYGVSELVYGTGVTLQGNN